MSHTMPFNQLEKHRQWTHARHGAKKNLQQTPGVPLEGSMHQQSTKYYAQKYII